MLSQRHSLGKQTFAVHCDSESTALLLRSRLSECNRSLLIPVIERVLDECSLPGHHHRVEQLEVDLGNISLNELEELAPERLYRELKEALERALHRAAGTSTETEAVTQIRLIEHFLLSGTLPYSASHATEFKLADALLALLQTDPVAGIELLRRTAKHRYALERIVRQLSVRELERLVALLDPEHAMLLLSYRTDLTLVHHTQPIIAVESNAFDRLLWTAILQYLLREAGSQFNRRMILRSLLEAFALHHGIAFLHVLEALQRSLENVAVHLPVNSSLPAAVADLFRETGAAPFAREPESPFKRGVQTGHIDLSEIDPSEEAASQWITANDRSASTSLRIESLTSGSFATGSPGSPRSGSSAMTSPAATSQAASSPSEWAQAWHPSDLPSDESQTSSTASGHTDQSLPNQYEVAEFLRFYAAYRVLPWQAMLRYPAASPAYLITRLPDLPPSLIRTILPPTAPESHADTLASLLHILPAARLHHLLSRLLPAAGQPSSPLASAIATHLRKTHAPVPFYVRLIVDTLLDREINLEPAPIADAVLNLDASTASNPYPDDDPSSWDIRSLQSAIAAQLTSGSSASPPTPPRKLPPLARLAALMLQRDKEAAYAFLATLHSHTSLATTIAADATDNIFSSLLKQLTAPKDQQLLLLLAALKRLPGPDQSSVQQLRFILIDAILRRQPARELDIAFFQHVLGRLFPSPLPKRIRTALLSAIPQEGSILRGALDGNKAPAPDLQHDWSMEQILDLLLHQPSNAPSAHLRDILLHRLETMLTEHPEIHRSALLKRLKDPQNSEKLASKLPESTLMRLVKSLDSANALPLQQAAELLISININTKNALIPTRALLWASIFEVIATGSPSPQRLIQTIFRRFFPTQNSASSADSQPFLQIGLQLSKDAGYAGLTEALQQALEKRSNANPTKKAANTMQNRPNQHHTTSSSTRSNTKKEQPELRTIYIHNAGLVLVTPFLPQMFQSLDMMQRGQNNRLTWKSPDLACRAVHLLQFLVDGQTSAPEATLPLNKLICGLPLEAPIDRSIELSPQEHDACASVTSAILAHWQVVSNSSPEGLRETFFQREGKLEHKSDRWALSVQRKTLDVLVDQIPWSFRIIFHDWMTEPLHVNW